MTTFIASGNHSNVTTSDPITAGARWLQIAINVADINSDVLTVRLLAIDDASGLHPFHVFPHVDVEGITYFDLVAVPDAFVVDALADDPGTYAFGVSGEFYGC